MYPLKACHNAHALRAHQPHLLSIININNIYRPYQHFKKGESHIVACYGLHSCFAGCRGLCKRCRPQPIEHLRTPTKSLRRARAAIPWHFTAGSEVYGPHKLDDLNRVDTTNATKAALGKNSNRISPTTFTPVLGFMLCLFSSVQTCRYLQLPWAMQDCRILLPPAELVRDFANTKERVPL
jgi:hypothetical protein